MKKVDLTKEETEILTTEISTSLEYRNKQLRKNILYVILGATGAAIIFFIKQSYIVDSRIIGTLLIDVFMSFNLLIFWFFSRNQLPD